MIGTITGLSAPANFGSNDNVLLISSPYVTNGGVSFTTASDIWNLYNTGSDITLGKALELYSAHGYDSFGALTISAATPVPEPAAIGLFGLGLLGLGAIRRRA